MGLFDFLFGSKSNSGTLYSSEEMIQLTSKWKTDFLQSAPKLRGATYDKEEIYLFCGWITLDYGKSYGYLSKNLTETNSLKRFSKLFAIRGNTINQTWSNLCLESANTNHKRWEC